MTDKDEIRSLRQRWDDNRRNQLGITQALLTTLAAGGLAFCGNLLMKESAKFGDFATTMFIWTSSAFALSVVLGLLSTLTRLVDFRLSATIPRKRLLLIEKKPVDGLSLPQVRCVTTALGKCTWGLLYLHFIALVLAMCLLPITLFHLFFRVIYPH